MLTNGEFCFRNINCITNFVAIINSFLLEFENAIRIFLQRLILQEVECSEYDECAVL